MTKTPLLTSADIPQADNPEELLALARYICEPKTYPMPKSCLQPRNLKYYKHALKIIGALDQNELPTKRLTQLTGIEEHAKGAFITGLSQSKLGQAWLQWQNSASLIESDPKNVDAFLTEHLWSVNETKKRRGQTFKRWLKWCKGQPIEVQQMDLFSTLANETLKPSLPDILRAPHNEGTKKVRTIVDSDLNQGDVLIVTGFASIDEIVKLLAKRHETASRKVRIVLGNEPFLSTKLRTARHNIKDEVRDYWLERGISILFSADILQAKASLENHQADIRIAGKRKDLHAKIYLSQEAVTLGSSNFTYNGLGGQSEANIRFNKSEWDRYQEIQALAEHFWQEAEDYTLDFQKLLDQLLKAVTWEEALARACAEILEGEWAKKYIPADEIDELEHPLWPHQKQGLSQALWTLHNLGSVLIADAAGSGKTRMGAWILRALHDMQIRAGHEQRFQPVLITPPGVMEHWDQAIKQSQMYIQPHSHGVLSSPNSKKNKSHLMHLIEGTSLLAIDEAHNFINNSSTRTQSLMNHNADNVVLFTATPINKRASDLLGMIELLGADNFSEEARHILIKLNRQSAYQKDYSELKKIRIEIQRFLVRRTRKDLNQLSDKFADEYKMEDGRQARYPHHKPLYYALPLSEQDTQIAAKILVLSEKLTGIARFGTEIYLPPKLAKKGTSESKYLEMYISASSALSQYTLLDCLRSSRAAAYEHIHGTAAAIEKLVPGKPDIKKDTGNTVNTLLSKAGQTPSWKFKTLNKADWPTWLWDKHEHEKMCQKEAEIYSEIAEWVLALSSEREEFKAQHLINLSQKKGLVIGFDSHILSLEIFQKMIQDLGVDCETFTGAHGAQGKARAIEGVGKTSAQRQFIALCSDALSEGLNMQGASVVVHLDTPTVIRIAEQRAGRVDRMDSKHSEVEIWWPNEKGALLPQDKDRLRLRHEIVVRLIGANLEFPIDDEEEEIQLLDQDLPDKANLEREDLDLQGIFDAFQPVKKIVEPGGLVSELTYEMIKNSQSRVVACVSAVKASQPWAFFAVGGPHRIAPRWVFINSAQAEPQTSLDEVSEALFMKLSAHPEPHELDEQAKRVMQMLLKQLEKSQQALLPRKRQKALNLAKKLLLNWRKSAKEEKDFARDGLLNELESYLLPNIVSGPSPNLRMIADTWLNLFRPFQKVILEERKGRNTLWQLEDLEDYLCKNPISTLQLENAFGSIPTISPLSDRIVAAIIGVPDSWPVS
jgi:superfamily II DNA or RNA helicase